MKNRAFRITGLRWRLVIVVGMLVVLVPLLSSPVLADGGGGTDDGFLLGGTAQPAQDPENAANDVIRIRTDQSPFFGTVSRKLNVKVDTLDNMLEFKSYFVAPKSCFGGAPRMTLLVDADGDGDFQQGALPGSDFAAHGHVNPPSTAGCLSNVWRYDDFTDDGGRWEVTPATAFPAIGNFPYDPWDTFEAAVMTQAPNHLVCTGFLVDDTFLVDPNNPTPNVMTGTAYYDIISIGRATWEDHDDTAGRGFAGGCGRVDDDDDGDDDGDEDHDGDVDDADDEFDDNRRD